MNKAIQDLYLIIIPILEHIYIYNFIYSNLFFNNNNGINSGIYDFPLFV